MRLVLYTIIISSFLVLQTFGAESNETGISSIFVSELYSMLRQPVAYLSRLRRSQPLTYLSRLRRSVFYQPNKQKIGINSEKKKTANRKAKLSKSKRKNVRKTKRKGMKNAQTEQKQRKSKAKKKMNRKSTKKPKTKGKNRVKKVKKKMVKKKRKFNSRPEKPKKETSGTQSKVKGESEAGRVGETNSAYDFQNTKKIDWTLPEYRCPNCEDTLIVYDPWFAPPPQTHIPIYCSSNLSDFSATGEHTNFGPNITFIFIPGKMNCTNPALVSQSSFSVQLSQDVTDTSGLKQTFYDCGSNVEQNEDDFNCGERVTEFGINEDSHNCFWHINAYQHWRRTIVWKEWNLPACPDGSTKGECCKNGPHMLISKTGYAKKLEAFCGGDPPKIAGDWFEVGRPRWLVVYNNTLNKDEMSSSSNRVRFEARSIGYRRTASYDQHYYGKQPLCGLREVKRPDKDPLLTNPAPATSGNGTLTPPVNEKAKQDKPFSAKPSVKKKLKKNKKSAVSGESGRGNRGKKSGKTKKENSSKRLDNKKIKKAKRKGNASRATSKAKAKGSKSKSKSTAKKAKKKIKEQRNDHKKKKKRPKREILKEKKVGSKQRKTKSKLKNSKKESNVKKSIRDKKKNTNTESTGEEIYVQEKKNNKNQRKKVGSKQKKKKKNKKKLYKKKKKFNKNKTKRKRGKKKSKAAKQENVTVKGPEERFNSLWPWLVSVVYDDAYVCTGYAISPSIVVVVTKCFHWMQNIKGTDSGLVADLNTRVKKIFVIGQDDKNIGVSSGYWEEKRSVKEIRLHPDCNPVSAPQFCVMGIVLSSPFEMSLPFRTRPACLTCKLRSYDDNEFLRAMPLLAGYGLRTPIDNQRASTFVSPSKIKDYVSTKCVEREGNSSTAEVYCLKTLGAEKQCDTARRTVGGKSILGHRDYGAILMSRFGQKGYKITFQVVGLLWDFSCGAKGPAAYIPTWPALSWMFSLVKDIDKLPPVRLVRKSEWTRKVYPFGYYDNGNEI